MSNPALTPADLTVKMIEKFIRLRNRSGYTSNLQFSLDASESGFSIEALGQPQKIEDDFYRWVLPFGVLIEASGLLTLDRRNG